MEVVVCFGYPVFFLAIGLLMTPMWIINAFDYFNSNDRYLSPLSEVISIIAPPLMVFGGVIGFVSLIFVVIRIFRPGWMTKHIIPVRLGYAIGIAALLGPVFSPMVIMSDIDLQKAIEWLTNIYFILFIWLPFLCSTHRLHGEIV